MKIALTGVSSTGKTSLSKEIAKKLKLSWLSEGCNGAFEYITRNNIHISTSDFSKMTGEDHVQFELALMATRTMKELEVDEFVADGEPLLWSSYMLLKGALSINEDLMTSYLDSFDKWTDQYDLIFYCPFGRFPIVSDGYRIDNKHFLGLQDAVLKERIRNYTEPFNHKAKIIELKSSFFEYRIGEIIKVIENAS